MRKVIILIAVALVAILGVSVLSGCAYSSTERENYDKRTELAAEYDSAKSLEIANLKAKRALEDDPDAIRYLYLMDYGNIVGYYVTKGKISSNASQIAPESEVISVPGTNGLSAERFLTESAKDDGSYGMGDPGVFFFTTDGVMIETDVKYLMSTAPIAIDVPRLG